MAELIESYEERALSRLGTLRGALKAVERDASAEAIKDAMQVSLQLTEAIGDLSEILIAMLDRIEGDVDLENSHDREEDNTRFFLPVYGDDQSKGPDGFKDMRKKVQ
jgi:hypothetical protein|tara:strand:+ start:1158 stop:1478 length:321 start_codon:yes stop_codon:yes gene_type:complete